MPLRVLSSSSIIPRTDFRARKRCLPEARHQARAVVNQSAAGGPSSRAKCRAGSKRDAGRASSARRSSFFQRHAAHILNAAKVLATRVHEHDVLGALFFRSRAFSRSEALVFGFVLAAQRVPAIGRKNVPTMHLQSFPANCQRRNIVLICTRKDTVKIEPRSCRRFRMAALRFCGERC